MPVNATYPGVYVEEIQSGVRAIAGVPTAVVAIVGRAARGTVNTPVVLNNFGDYERAFGGLWQPSTASFAMRDFFLNGGGQAIAVRLFAPSFEDEPSRAQAEAEAQAAADTVSAAATAAVAGGTAQSVADAASAAVAAAGAPSDAALSSATSVGDAAQGAVAGGQAVQAAADAIAAAATDAVAGGATAQEVADAAAAAVAGAGASGADALAAATAVSDAAAAAVPGAGAAQDVADAATAAAAGFGAQFVGDAAAAGVADAVGAAAPVTRARIAMAGGFELEAASEGSWGNGLRARIEHVDPAMVGGATDLFNLVVRDGQTGDVEVFRNLSVGADHPRRVDLVLANGSGLVRSFGALAAARPPASGNVPLGADPFDAATSTGVSTAASDGVALSSGDYIASQADKTGIYALDDADIFNILCLPPMTHDLDIPASVWTAAAVYCEAKRAMLLVDPPSGWGNVAQAVAGIGVGVGTVSRNAALFFPRLRQPNPLRDNLIETYAPCGVVAGIMGRTDARRGVWKAPAGLEATMRGVPGLSVPLSNAENGQLNPLGVNCLRTIQPAGRVVWGARTLQGDDRFASEWKYIPVRRTALYIQESLFRGIQWVVFEPNDEPLWAQIRLNVGAFLNGMFRQGAFQGQSASDAYFVKCDSETTTQADIDRGFVNIVVGFAPLKPAEFVILKIQQIAGGTQG